MDLDALGILSHELRTPLTCVHGYALLLQQELALTLSLPQRERLDTIVKNSSLMLDLINDLLLFARVQSGQQQISAVPVMVDEVLQAAYEVVEHKLLEKNLDFDIVLPDPPPVVLGNFELLRQVFVNLLANAVKFTETGTITVRVQAVGKEAMIEVEDSGIGIAPEQLPYIFDEFRQAHSGIRRLYGGTGLGLHICQTLVKLHGGEISADSKAGEGTTFTVRLPLDEDMAGGERGLAVADPWVGKVVEGYELVAKIGVGGASSVYRGVRAGADDVAIKVMRDSAMSVEQADIDVMAGLTHPNIVRILSSGSGDRFRYIVMELASGQTLRHFMTMRRRLGLDDFTTYFVALLEAVAFAHRHGVAHRDLKPENVMVDGASLKLMDFGMARPDMVATLASGGLVIGTPAYLAPEQFEGGEVGPACDQYALGVMAFEMLMGELPFKGPSLVRYMVQHTAQVPPVLSRPDVPETLVRAVDRMLAKSAAERFASVDEVLEVMRAVQAS